MASKDELLDKFFDYSLTMDFLLILLCNYFSTDELEEFANYIEHELNEG